MFPESPPVSVGDYGACVGTTGSDLPILLPNGASLALAPNGVFLAVTGTRFTAILDGLSNTLLVGEKHLPLGQHGMTPWDCGLYDGHNVLCSTRGAGPRYPLAALREDVRRAFGSPHPGVCQFVFCDGSVRSLANGTDPAILGLLAQRDDGQVVPGY
jgi:prepilin-type processing-associated H-X9-DG protein